MPASAVPNIDVAAMMADPEVKKAAPKETPLEAALADVSPEEAAAGSPAEAKFSFRSLLSDEQLKALKESAPSVAERMIKDYSFIIKFGSGTLDRMNQTSIAMLDEQKNIKIPEADQMVNNLLREMDGYSAKYRNVKMEDFANKLRKFFGGASYSIKTMIRDSQPISERLNDVEIKLRKMEMDLSANAARARKLREEVLETMDGVIVVLAALEEISDYLQSKFQRVDAILTAAGDQEQAIKFDGETYSLQEFREIHADLAQGISEVEKSWFTWRQQFFLGFADGPRLRNLIMVSASMERQVNVFRIQGVPEARKSLAAWQQAQLAKNGAEMGKSFQEATNKLVQGSAEATSDAVRQVAYVAQTPLITDETIFAVIDSVKQQAKDLIEADVWGREVRARNIAAMEAGEKAITEADEEGRRKLVANAISSARGDKIDSATNGSDDILGKLGVK